MTKEQCDCTSICGDDQRVWRGKVSMCQDRYQQIHFMNQPKPDWKYQLDLAEAKLAELSKQNNPARAAIQFALGNDDPDLFLRLWNEGEFDALRENWENIPDEVFIGAEVNWSKKS